MPKMDWTFATDNSKYASHGFHVYPTRMMPKVASQLIELYGSSNGLVLDPFCGSGGVLVESMLSGHPSVGLDINPLACLIARVKTTPIDPELLCSVWKDVYHCILKKTSLQTLESVITLFEKAANCDDRNLSTELINKASEKLLEEGLHVPELSRTNILYWFKPRTLLDLIIIVSNLNEIRQRKIREFFYVCFSATVRKVSGTRGREWKLYRIPMSKWRDYEPKAVEAFKNKVVMNIRKMKDFYQNFKELEDIPFAKIFEADCRNIFSQKFPQECQPFLYTKHGKFILGKVDLIVTSPPYGDSPTTVAYGQFSRYPMILLGYEMERARDIDKVSLGGDLNAAEDNAEIPSSTFKKSYRKIARKDQRRAKQMKSYFVDLDICLRNMHNVLRNAGVVSLVLGNRTIKGHRVPTDKVIVELGEEIGFLPPPRIYTRRIPRKRIPWKIRSSNSPRRKIRTIAHENIIVLKKPD